MVRKYYEVECDNCHMAEHFHLGLSYQIQAKQTGWVISKYGDCCCEECLIELKKSKGAKNEK